VTVVIRKEEAGEAPPHGGAWKVAYADFVTAMMAFFLLMWLLNATTEEQRRGRADYFAPSNLFSHGSSGTGDPFGGHTAFDQGGMVSDRGAVQAIPGNRPAATDRGDAEAQQARLLAENARGDAEKLVSDLVKQGRRQTDSMRKELERMMKQARKEVERQAKPVRKQATQAARRAAKKLG